MVKDSHAKERFVNARMHVGRLPETTRRPQPEAGGSSNDFGEPSDYKRPFEH